MGLQDRDWYHEAIANKNKKKQKVIGAIWTPDMLDRPRSKKTFSWWIGRFAGIAVIVTITVVLIKLIFGR
ncbi:hypothetical protein [Methylomonas koyamae]|uniref:hypothetical protein n=1 Tax=Methylomonas koyamae TaxID=702114 RepID=UPI0012F660F2|nr:hypothetical protein [Methylomonas koyamae]